MKVKPNLQNPSKKKLGDDYVIGVPVYVSKPGEWYEEGTICILIDDYRPKIDSGLFYGIRRCENPASEAHAFGELYYDEEICRFSEFDIHFVHPAPETLRKIKNKYDETSPEIEDMMKYGVR